MPILKISEYDSRDVLLNETVEFYPYSDEARQEYFAVINDFTSDGLTLDKGYMSNDGLFRRHTIEFGVNSIVVSLDCGASEPVAFTVE